MKITLKNFILPTQDTKAFFDFERAKVCAIIPTYKPGELTVRLVKDLVRFNPHIRVYVVDDCTPDEYGTSTRIFELISSISPQVMMLRTPVNTLKAGALNYALKHIAGTQGSYYPDAIVTLDDDVVINRLTIRNLVTGLMSHPRLGAACSECRVFNKDKNILTRLQGLEYLGFNAVRLADEGFVQGPLVMHGMLTAFRTAALSEAGLFAEGHLIEDYEMTTRLKALGWNVRVAVGALASTAVPESFSALWRQRTRWSYGGITVVMGAKDLSSVLQDLIGHGVFVATLLMIDVLLFSTEGTSIPQYLVYWIIAISFLQFALWYFFQLWLMRLYKEKDRYDWIIRVSVFPEFIYGNVMTLVLIGSYLFLFFTILKRILMAKGGQLTKRLVALGAGAFHACGYTEGWGTRAN